MKTHKTVMYSSIAKRNIKYVKNISFLWKQTLPQIAPYYAIKACPDEELLDFIASNKDFGFDYASKNELKMIERYEPQNTIFANPTKSILDIQYSADAGHHNYVVDSIEEIVKINSIDKDAQYFIRIQSNELFSAIKFNNKFGVTLNEFETMIEFLYNMNLPFKGISYHVGSKCTDMKAHNSTLTDIVEMYMPVLIKYGMHPSIIDIGGGFENVYQLLTLRQEIDSFLSYFEANNIQLIAEPGRLFCSGYIDVVTNIIAIREKTTPEGTVYYITVNDSVYHTFQGKIFDGQQFTPTPLFNNDERAKCIIFGQTCDSLDIICDGIILPKPTIGDKLLFSDMGAYSIASCTGTFNGFTSAEFVKS